MNVDYSDGRRDVFNNLTPREAARELLGALGDEAFVRAEVYRMADRPEGRAPTDEELRAASSDGMTPSERLEVRREARERAVRGQSRRR